MCRGAFRHHESDRRERIEAYNDGDIYIEKRTIYTVITVLAHSKDLQEAFEDFSRKLEKVEEATSWRCVKFVQVEGADQTPSTVFLLSQALSYERERGAVPACD